MSDTSVMRESVTPATAPMQATDALGRKLAIRKLTALQKMRMFKAIGAADAMNQPVMGMAILACSVIAIDDVPLPFPTSPAQLEALVEKLGDEGLEAVGATLGDAVAVDANETRDLAKN